MVFCFLGFLIVFIDVKVHRRGGWFQALNYLILQAILTFYDCVIVRNQGVNRCLAESGSFNKAKAGSNDPALC